MSTNPFSSRTMQLKKQPKKKLNGTRLGHILRLKNNIAFVLTPMDLLKT